MRPTTDPATRFYQRSGRGSPALPGQILGGGSEILQHIREPGVNLCLWQRPADTLLLGELEPLQALRLPAMRCPTGPVSFDHDVVRLMRQHGLSPCAFAHWRSDLRLLADLFFQVCDGPDATLRIEIVTDDACRRFHVDLTGLRLLCTYYGPGTEWLTDAQVDRLAQRRGASNEAIIRFGEASRFAPFWVGILKGDAYPGNAGQGLVHRSPPITGSGQVRILFSLDA